MPAKSGDKSAHVEKYEILVLGSGNRQVPSLGDGQGGSSHRWKPSVILRSSNIGGTFAE
jgi:hypothetical protein